MQCAFVLYRKERLSVAFMQMNKLFMPRTAAQDKTLVVGKNEILYKIIHCAAEICVTKE